MLKTHRRECRWGHLAHDAMRPVVILIDLQQFANWGVGGILVAEDSQAGLRDSSGGLNIGCGSDSVTGTFWSGLIDDVRIYDRAVTP